MGESLNLATFRCEVWIPIPNFAAKVSYPFKKSNSAYEPPKTTKLAVRLPVWDIPWKPRNWVPKKLLELRQNTW